MLITKSGFFRCYPFSHLNSNRSSSKRCLIPPVLANKKKGVSEISSPEENKAIFPLNLARSKILLQSAIGVFALGFIDAGYSGDWARIGVISRGTEDILKAAAFLLVPLCLFLIFSLSKKVKE